MKRMIIVFVATILVATAVTGCNTVRGAGEDIESVVEEFED